MSRVTQQISRRQMLKLMAAGTAATWLAACAPKATEVPAAEPTSVPAVEATEPAATVAAPPTQTPGAEMVTGAVVESYEAGQQAYGWYDEHHPSNPVELLIWGPSGDETSPFIRVINAAMDRFAEKYPEITLHSEPVPWGDLDTKINAAVAAKQGPDIIWEADREGEYARRGVIRPIDDIIRADYISEHKFYEVRPLDDGKLYWIHTSIMGPIVYGNKQIMEEAGITAEDVPTSWEEFAKFCQQFTQFEGDQMTRAGFAFNGYARYIWDDMMYQQGAHVQSATKSFINSSESAHAWQTLVDMYDTYKINDRAFLNFDEAFGTGNAAFAQVWTWFGDNLAENYPDVEWIPVLYPTFSGEGPYGRFDYDGPGWMITTLAEDEKLDAAREFFLFHAYDYQYLVERSHSQGLVLVTEPHPNYEKLFAEVRAKENPTVQDNIDASLAVLSKEFAGGMTFPGEVSAPFDGMWQQMEEAILYNNRPIDEVLTEYEGLYDEMLANTNFWVTPEA